MEEVLHLEHPLRGVHVLVVDHAADRRFVHPDVCRHISEHQRAKIFDASLKEFGLERDDASGHFVDGLLPLIDRLDEPERRPKLFFHIRPRLVVALFLLVQETTIDGTDAQLRHAVFVQGRDIPLFGLDDVHIRDHVMGRGGVETTARLRIEMANDFNVMFQLVDRDVELARQLVSLVVLQEFQMFADDRFGRGTVQSQALDLQEETLLEVASCDADGVEFLQHPQHTLDLVERPATHRCDFLD